MSAPRLRLFVGVTVPSEQLEALHRAASPLRRLEESTTKARWTKPANQHLTLKFLGWVDAADAGAIRGVLGDVAGAHGPSRVALRGLGAWPTERRARVLWVGLEDPERLLTKLAASLDSALEALGFERETRAFTPHLTLARFTRPASVSRVMAEPFEVLEPWFAVDRVALYRSHLHPKGARYEILESFALEIVQS
ncbi:MAG: RNA 2',3'-cyclic phosphodiesterase [Actinomycetota bacterium]